MQPRQLHGHLSSGDCGKTAPPQRCIYIDTSVIGAGASGRLLSAMEFLCLEAALVIGFLEAIDALSLLWRGLGGYSVAGGEDNGLVQATVAVAGVVRLLATVVGMDNDGI